MAYFNSLPHAEANKILKVIVFQLTTSRRGRQLSAIAGSSCTLFQLTTSRRGRPFAALLIPCSSLYFNSLPHAEVDDVEAPGVEGSTYFNSLPHAEVDPGS